MELLARQDGYYTRIKDAVIQGSNDNSKFGNIAEVRFHGDLDYDAAYFDSIVRAADGYT